MFTYRSVFRVVCVSALVLIPAVSAFGVVVYNENIQGDLPNVADPPPPTIPLLPGPNELIAKIGGTDREDVFVFDVPPDFFIDDVMVDQSVEVDFSFNDLSMVLIVDRNADIPLSGTVYSLPFDETQPTSTDLFNNALLLEGPAINGIGAGVHRFVMKLDGIDPFYTITFNVVPVPEPATALLLLLPGAACALRRRSFR